MGLFSFLVLLLIAGICGSLGQTIGGYSRGGCLVSIVLGFIGSLIGVWLARALDLPEVFTLNLDGVAFPVLWSIIGSALFVAILGFLSRPGEVTMGKRQKTLLTWCLLGLAGAVGAYFSAGNRTAFAVRRAASDD